MTAKEKYKKLFGSINSLAEDTSWTLGLVGLLEHFSWGTDSILGITKTKLVETIVEMSDSDKLSMLSTNEKIKKIKYNLKILAESLEKDEKFNSSTTGYCTAREALRRSRFFSEDYLNAEFNIFMSLCSDNYLNCLYKDYIDFNDTGSWSTHGNGGIFQISSGIDNKMQMDNLAYNKSENLLVANELKLGGMKNKDQILKYCFMYKILIDNTFIEKDSKYLLLFISDKDDNFNRQNELEKEITYVKNKPNLAYLLDDEILKIASNLNLKSITWNELIVFNQKYIFKNNICQVERKLIDGFNKTLREKAFIQ